MSIEFRCTTCDKLLRTQAGTEGKKAKCPQCGTVLTIPAAAPPSFEAPPPREPNFSAPPPPPREPDFAATVTPASAAPPGANPYQSPTAYEAQTERAPGDFRPTRIELGETLSRAWEIYKRNLGACILGGLVFFGANLIAGGILGFIVGFASVPFAKNGNNGALLMLNAVQQLASQCVTVFFLLGIFLFMLRLARGGSAEYSLIFGGGPYFVRGFFVQLITGLAFIVGLILFVIPGIILGLMFSQSLIVLVDRKTSVMDSLRLSAEIMKGNKLTVLGTWIVAGLLALVVTLLTCGIGFFVAWPFMMMLMAVIYLSVSGQPTVLDTPPATDERGFSATGAQPG